MAIPKIASARNTAVHDFPLRPKPPGIVKSCTKRLLRTGQNGLASWPAEISVAFRRSDRVLRPVCTRLFERVGFLLYDLSRVKHQADAVGIVDLCPPRRHARLHLFTGWVARERLEEDKLGQAAELARLELQGTVNKTLQKLIKKRKTSGVATSRGEHKRARTCKSDLVDVANRGVLSRDHLKH